MTDLVSLSFDDEEAGGWAVWYEKTVPGAIPVAGDWVWHEGVRYVVVLRGWTFVQDGSLEARNRNWEPIVRVHVRRTAGDDIAADDG
jgi:hypothetical protein